MSWIYSRLDRLRQIVAECVKRDLNPSKVGFADFVQHISASFGVTPQTAKGYIITLVEAYHHNAWLSYIKHNDYLNEQEKEKWINQHSNKQ